MPEPPASRWPRLDEANECLWWDERRADLPAKAYRVLRFLVQRPHQMVTKTELIDAVWADAHVIDAVLTVAISQLREALGDDARQPRFIETIHRRGYRWIGRFEGDEEATPHARDTARAEAALPARSQARGLAGRGAEIALLEQALARAAGGRRQMVFLAGDPGIGKTALVDAFVERFEASEWLVARGQCVDAYGVGEPYMPVLEALERLCRSQAELVEIVRRDAPTWILQMPGLLSAGESEELRRTLAGSAGERMVREFVRASEVIAALRPMVLVFEDLHWSDPATVSLLAALAARRERAPLLVLATYRSVDAVALMHPLVRLRHELVSRRECVAIELGGLDDAAVAAFLDARFPANRFSPSFATQLRLQTGGNPLFVLNAVDDFEQRGWLRCEEDGTWEWIAPSVSMATAIPDGTRAMIEFRVDQLSAEVQGLLEAASVVGDAFSTEALATAVSQDVAHVEAECHRLARSGALLRADPEQASPGYAFCHALYRQVLYARVAPTQRRILHQRVGEHLEAGFREGAGELAGQIALHLERGSEPLRAVRYCREAARVAQGRYAPDQEIEHLRRGLGILERLPADAAHNAIELELRSALLTPVYAAVGAASGEVEAIAERVLSLSRESDVSRELLQALGVLISVRMTTANLRETQALCEQAVARSAGTPWDFLFSVVTKGLWGLCRLLRGNLREGAAEMEACVDLPDLVPLTPLEPAVSSRSDSGLALCLLGDLEAGIARLESARARAEESRHPPSMVYAAGNVLRAGMMLDDRRMVESVTPSIAAPAERFGVRRWSGTAMLGQGWLLAADGDAAGIDLLREGSRVLREVGHQLVQPLQAAATSSALLRFGRADEAFVQLDEALAWVEETDERWCESELHRLRGLAILATQENGRPSRRSAIRRDRPTPKRPVEEAEGCFRRAIDVARGQDARWWELRSAVRLARLLRSEGRSAEAEALLRPLLASFPARPELPDLVEAAAFLAGPES